MIVTMFFHGGSSYAPFSTHEPRDAEQFPSLRAAVAEFRSRVGFHPYYPCTDDSAEAWVFLARKRDAIGQEYPDRIIRRGPRGGIIVEAA